jgi:hypothetical protein
MASSLAAVENRGRKARGIALLSAVFGELSQNLSDTGISTEELLGAAQKLIELSKRDYVTNTHPDGQKHDGYYSYDLWLAFNTYQGRILENEIVVQDDEPPRARCGTALKRLLEGSQEDMFLEDVYG